MASIFRDKKTGFMLIEFTQASGERRRVYTGRKSKRDAKRLADQLESEVYEIRHGLCDNVVRRRRIILTQPVEVVLKTYHDMLLRRGNNERYCQMQIRMINRMCSYAKIDIIADLTGVTSGFQPDDAVVRFLMSKSKLTAVTRNKYLGAIHAFCRWLQHSKQVNRSPVQNLKSERNLADHRRRRRSYSDEEINLLLESTRESKRRMRIPARSRELLYMFALGTGLRRSEIASLRPRDIVLDDSSPHVQLRAAYSKSRKAVFQPLSDELVSHMREFLARQPKRKPIWDMPANTARMIQTDLRDAGIAVVDAEGRVLDFHSLRHTFITRLVRAGVPSIHVKTLARHSTIEMTLRYYTHLEGIDLRKALNQIPIHIDTDY